MTRFDDASSLTGIREKDKHTIVVTEKSIVLLACSITLLNLDIRLHKDVVA
jgi:hypothetical protein